MTTAILKRLDALETRLQPIYREPLTIGLYASTLDDICRIQAKYPFTPGAMVRMIPVYHGEPSTEAAALVPPEDYRPKAAAAEG